MCGTCSVVAAPFSPDMNAYAFGVVMKNLFAHLMADVRSAIRWILLVLLQNMRVIIAIQELIVIACLDCL